MIVVSEIGEQWSPQTAPAIQAEIEIIISSGFVSWNTATTIGIKIPNVPQDVPVANARKQPMMNTIAGRNAIRLPANPFTAISTYSFAPRLSVIDFNDQANVKIIIAGTIALKPSGIQLIQSENVNTLRATYKMIVINIPKKLPIARPTEASQFENAVIKSSPLKNPPV